MKLRLAAVALALLGAACEAQPAAIQPTARYATVASVAGGRVYVIGGIQRGAAGDTTLAAVEAYDPASRVWTRCAPMPTPRSFAAAAVFDGKTYVFGGLDGANKALATVEAYDPARDTWTACAPMEAPRSRLAAVNRMRHGIIVAGGMDADGKNSGDVRIYLPREDKWRSWAFELSPPRHGFGLIDADDTTEHMFAVGGYGDAGALARTDVFGIGTVKVLNEDGTRRYPLIRTTDVATGKVTVNDKDYQGYDWWPGPALVEARGFFGCASISSLIYAVGGRCLTIPRTEILDMDDVAAGWKQAAPLPKDLCRFSLVEWKGHLLAFGGETDSGKAVNTDVLEYDPTADTWSVR